jgi:hypothetical protein
MMRTYHYHSAGCKVTDCNDCGEVTTCQVYVADSPERETGYVDEVSFCPQCDPNGKDEPEYEPEDEMERRTR